MSSNRRLLASPKAFIVSKPRLGDAVSDLLGLGSRVENLLWNGFVNPVVDVGASSYDLIYALCANTGDGDGNQVITFDDTNDLVVAGGQFWELINWYIYCVNCDVTEARILLNGSTTFRVSNTAATDKWHVTLSTPLPCVAATKFGFTEANDAGADVVYNMMIFRRYLDVKEWELI